MRRRDFITLLSGAGVVWPLAAHGQRAGKIWRIGFIEHEHYPTLDPLLFDSLRELGYVEGQNIIIERRYALYRGEQRVSMRRMTAGAKTGGRPGRARKHHGGERPGVETADAPLFEALRAWRRERAAEQRVPPYVIFHDATPVCHRARAACQRGRPCEDQRRRPEQAQALWRRYAEGGAGELMPQW